MTFAETLEYLYQQLPMFQRIGPAAYKKDLTNTLALCARLDQPHTKYPAIHVGGTNGKGSVSHLLAALCTHAGLKTGLYISPHYKSFTERIKIDGQPISKRRVTAFVSRHRAALDEIRPSFFEMCVAMAFDHFAREKVDIAIIEVGLGGRLDSTNVITPLLSVITNISYDHTDLLGDTLPKIAFEKAGIIKPGVPVVIGETHPESAPVFLEKAASTGSSLQFADEHLRVEMSADPSDFFRKKQVIQIMREGRPWLTDVETDLIGPYQSKNIATALTAWQALQGLPLFAGRLSEQQMREALGSVIPLSGFMGRWQVLQEQPLVLCDSAHNEGGLRLSFERLRAWQQQSGANLHIVTGMVRDKDLSKALALFPTEARYYFAKANIPRGLEADLLQREAAVYGLQGRAWRSVSAALAAARRAARPRDLIVVIGSIFVVGEVL